MWTDFPNSVVATEIIVGPLGIEIDEKSKFKGMLRNLKKPDYP